MPIDNALKFAGDAYLSIERSADDTIAIRVLDTGDWASRTINLTLSCGHSSGSNKRVAEELVVPASVWQSLIGSHGRSVASFDCKIETAAAFPPRSF